MNVVFAIAGRELKGYFSTVIGWLTLLGFVFFNGMIFFWVTKEYAKPSMNPMGAESYDINKYLIPDFFGTISFLLLLLIPALSMRLFSEDIKQKSFELLLSSPVSSWEIVMGKYLGGMGYVMVMLLSLSHCTLSIYWLGEPDTGVVLMNYLSLFCLSSCCISLGIMFSSFTKSQLIALSLSFISVLAFWVMSGIGQAADGALGEFLTYLSFMSHIENMGRGLFHIQDLVYFISFTFFFLFATLHRVEAFRWQ